LLGDAPLLFTLRPNGLLQAFGDSSANFELRAWTNAFADWSRIRSDLAIGVYDAVQGAAWSFPFPQHEVRLVTPPKTEGPAGEIPPIEQKRD
jgi:potassium-dependent mechanosensitive channel